MGTPGAEAQVRQASRDPTREEQRTVVGRSGDGGWMDQEWSGIGPGRKFVAGSGEKGEQDQWKSRRGVDGPGGGEIGESKSARRSN